MKATGIVRRIDELGRIVIPKEIRRTLRIRESDPMEIFTNHEGGIVLKKYSPIGELGDTAQEYVESVANVAKCTVCVADRDRIVAAAGAGPDRPDHRRAGVEQAPARRAQRTRADSVGSRGGAVFRRHGIPQPGTGAYPPA